MNKTYFKATIREISSSWGKFISIILIILLGSLLYVGIRSIGPDLNESGNQYFSQQKLSDLKVVSTMGLTDTDLSKIKTSQSVKSADAIHMTTLKKNRDQVVSVYGYQKAAKLDKLKVVSGHLPRQGNQIVLDNIAKADGYKLGETYKLPNNSHLKRQSYKIVGFVNSPQFISSIDRGTTNVGSGTINYFAYASDSVFKQDTYSMVAVQFKNAAHYAAGTDQYQRYIDQQSDQLKNSLKGRSAKRLAEVQKPQLAKINKQLKQVDAQQTQLTAAAAAGQSAQLTTQQAKLTQAKQKLTKARDQVQNLAKPTYTYADRQSNPGYQDYFDESHSIAAIAVIFPGFFLFIAILITFSTISRMVEKNRREIGLMRALGYNKMEISLKYVIYALLAGLLGAIIGSVAGMFTLPRFVFSLLANNNINDFVGVVPWSYMGQTIVAGLVATLASALIVLVINLREVPTNLMQAKAPKAGKRILIERITPLWNHLNFNQKVSYRNLFRYKGRMILTIVGIAGCTGLILSGFGIQDSVNDLIPDQYEQIQHFQGVATLNKASQQIHSTKISSQKSAVMKSVTVRAAGSNSNDTATLIAPKTGKNFTKFVSLKSASTNKQLHLSNSGVIISEKLATDMNAKVGSRITLNSDEKQVSVKVTGVTKNYAGHWLYTTKAYYQKVMPVKFAATSVLFKTNQVKKHQRTNLSRTLLKQDGVLNVSFPRYSVASLGSGGLGSVVLIMIVMSGALALVVLYNLTNINISERLRELSTIKVLGFYDREVTAYVARENVIFTIAGIIVGWGIGVFLHRFIMIKAQTGSILFPLVIHYPGFLWSALITLVFSIIIGVITHFQLKNIRMLDALSSSE